MHERVDSYGCKERVRQSQLQQETLTKDNDVNSAHDPRLQQVYSVLVLLYSFTFS